MRCNDSMKVAFCKNYKNGTCAATSNPQSMDNFQISDKKDPSLRRSICKDCQKIKNNEWRINNPELKRAQRRREREKHGDEINARNREWRKDNAEQLKEYRRENRTRIDNNVNGWRRANPEAWKNIRLKSAFGITLDYYNSMLLAQGGGCALCNMKPNELGHALGVDHCHKTGKVRGLLDDFCNKAIGLMDDDAAVINRGIQYLSVKYDSSIKMPKDRKARRELRDGLIIKQDGRCAICLTQLCVDNKLDNLDHNHKTGVVRGVLCFRCNTSIAGFKENRKVMAKAAEYVIQNAEVTPCH